LLHSGISITTHGSMLNIIIVLEVLYIQY